MDKYLALAQAGFTLMQPTEGGFSEALGKAGVAGIQAYQDASDRYQTGLADVLDTEIALQKANASSDTTIDEINALTKSLEEANAAAMMGGDVGVDTGTIGAILMQKIRRLEGNVSLTVDLGSLAAGNEMGQIFRTGKSGQLYKANIAGTTPTAQELEQLNKLVTAQGDTLIGSQGPVDTTNPPGTALGRGFSMGIDQTQMMFGRALQSVGENLGFSGLEEYGEEVVAHNEAELGETAQYATRLEDVDGLSSGLSFFGETLGQGIATLLPTAGAALVTRCVCQGWTYAEMLQRTSFSAGAAVNYPILFGENLLEQDQSVEEGILPHVNDGAAALFALPATFLDTLGDRITLGLGGKITKPLLTKKTYQSVTGGAAARVRRGCCKRYYGRGSDGDSKQSLHAYRLASRLIVRMPTENTLEVGIAAGIVGGTIRGTADTLKGDQKVCCDCPAKSRPKRNGADSRRGHCPARAIRRVVK